MIDVRHMKKLFLWMLLTAGCNPKKNVLSSEAGCNIIGIIRRTRCAQTASHVDLLVSLRDTRIEDDSDNSTASKDLLVRNVFLRATALEQ